MVGWPAGELTRGIGSFPVLYLGSLRLTKSLRKTEFANRQTVVKEAIHRVREASKTRRPLDRAQFDFFAEFFDGVEPLVDVRDIDLSISTSGIVWASSDRVRRAAPCLCPPFFSSFPHLVWLGGGVARRRKSSPTTA